MKKIALVTCYFHPNYGSMLQAYATQEILYNWGVDCENICIDGIKHEIDSKKIKFYLKQIYKPEIFKGTFIRIVRKKIQRKINKKNLGEKLSLRNMYFDNFRKSMFNVSKKYTSMKQLTEACSNYSTVLVGSDQLWLPSNIEADYYTLSWVPDNVNKAAYATSFGSSFLPKNEQKYAGEFLSRFNHIAVREESGQKLIKKYADIDVPIVCDPTLLFTGDDWMAIQKRNRIIKEKYILCYFLGNNKLDREFAKRLREKTGLRIAALLHLDEYIKNDENYADITPYNIGPAELLNLIRNAEYIVTDSFHGSVFSILYKKTFFTSRRILKKGILCTNSRLDSLFDELGIEKRIINGDENIDECLSRKIDYEKVYRNLDKLRIQSKKYLMDALGLNRDDIQGGDIDSGQDEISEESKDKSPALC